MEMEQKPISDETLAVLVRTKNQELYRELVERYQEKIVKYITYLINDRNQALDVAQEVFLKAFINLWGFNPSLKFSSWIYRIAHNEAINFIKKSKKEILFEPENFPEVEDTKNDILVDLKNKELAEFINKGLSRLPLNYREPLALYYLEEKSYQEISDILRQPINTIGVNIMRGKKILRSIFQKNGYTK